MATTTTTSPFPALLDRLAEAEKWLDNRGKGAWIVLIVLGFIFVWPLGLALLLWVVWGRSLYARDEIQDPAPRSDAFETYRTETLHRLSEEQAQFDGFVDRLRSAKDKQEFDDFLDNRARAVKTARTEHDDNTDNGPKPATPTTNQVRPAGRTAQTGSES